MNPESKYLVHLIHACPSPSTRYRISISIFTWLYDPVKVPARFLRPSIPMAPSLKRQRLEASESQQEQEPHSRSNSPKRKKPCPRPAVISSPFQLTWIQDLPDELNQDAVTLQDLVGDPLIKECWNFNYMHDIPFLMDAFDRDVRGLVKVHIIHGYWKREDPGRLMIEVCTLYI